jgi:glutathione peroxidase
MSSKVDVKGSKVSPIYQWLTQKELNKLGDFEVSWNFNKFLVGPSGELIAHFPSSVKPLSNEITKLLK